MLYMLQNQVIRWILSGKVDTDELLAKASKWSKMGPPYHAFYRGKVEVMPKFQLYEPPNRNDMMSGDVSERRSDFPRVIQHSILGSSKIVGGPLLDLDGRCLGMYIARANRAESFAIPLEELKEIAERLMKEAAAAGKEKTTG